MIYESLFTIMLLVVAVVDIKKHIIPNRLLLGITAIALPCVILSVTLIPGLIGMSIGMALFGTLYFIAPDKIGGGDVKLAGLIGLMVGFPLILLVIPLAMIAGGLASFILVSLRGGSLKDIPYAPFLCGGAVVSLWSGGWITGWYLNLF